MSPVRGVSNSRRPARAAERPDGDVRIEFDLHASRAIARAKGQLYRNES